MVVGGHGCAAHELSRLERQVTKLHNEGRTDEALAVAAKTVALSEQGFGEAHLSTAANLEVLGSLYLAQGDIEKTVSLFDRAVKIKQNLWGREAPGVVATMQCLGKFYLDHDYSAQAASLYVQVSQITENTLGMEHPTTIAAFRDLADALDRSGAFSESRTIRTQILTGTEEQFGHDSIEAAYAIDELSRAYKELGDHETAIRLNRRALAIVEATWGPDHPEVARMIWPLANTLRRVGDFREAEELFLRALAMNARSTESNVGTKEQFARHLHNVGQFYHELKRYDEAERFYIQALLLWEKTAEPERTDDECPPDFYAFAWMLRDVGLLYLDTGRYPESEANLSGASILQENLFGRDHAFTRDTRNQLAHAIVARDRCLTCSGLLAAVGAR